MKYPLNTTSKPVVGAQAKKLLKAVKEGKSMTNDAAQITINRLIARRSLPILKRKSRPAKATVPCSSISNR